MVCEKCDTSLYLLKELSSSLTEKSDNYSGSLTVAKVTTELFHCSYGWHITIGETYELALLLLFAWVIYCLKKTILRM